jgi:hypothetical protein
MFLKLLHKIEMAGMLPYSFHEASITLITKTGKDARGKKKKQYRPVSLVNIEKFSIKYLKPSPTTH